MCFNQKECQQHLKLEAHAKKGFGLTSGQTFAARTSAGMSAMRPKPVSSTESARTKTLSLIPNALLAPATISKILLSLIS